MPPARNQIPTWELALVIALFSMSYGFMLNFLSGVVYFTGFFVNPSPPFYYLLLTIILYGVVPPAIAIIFTYLLIDGKITPAYVAKSEKAKYRFPRFILLLMGRIVLVSLSPVGCAFLTLSALNNVPDLIMSPSTTGRQVFFSLASALCVIWLVGSLIVVLIEVSISLRSKKNEGAEQSSRS